MLLKMLSSSLWGHLCKKNKITRTEQQIIDEGLKNKIGYSNTLEYKILSDGICPDGSEYFNLQSNEQPYTTTLARLKPFITSYGRVKTGETAMQMGLEDLVKLHTDGICSTKPFKEHITNFIVDKDSTGLFYFNRINQPLEQR